MVQVGRQAGLHKRADGESWTVRERSCAVRERFSEAVLAGAFHRYQPRATEAPRVGDCRILCKVDSDGRKAFGFSEGNIVHASLDDLVAYYAVHPLDETGNRELKTTLKYPVLSAADWT